MRRRWTRREILKTSLTGTAIIGGRSVRVLGVPLIQISLQEEGNAASALTPNLRDMLRIAADEIIPASDGMPAASEVGTSAYLEQVFKQSPPIKQHFQSGLPALEALSRDRFRKSFLKLSRADRLKALTEFEKAQPTFFATLRDFVYEGYYLQPQVWKLIGYEFYPLRKPVPSMKPFDEAVLAKVRKRVKIYREVG